MPRSSETTSTNLSPWVVPGMCVVIGLGYLLIGLAKDDATGGAIGLLIMLAYAGGLLLFRRRSEAVALLSAEVTDERQAKIAVGSLAATGAVLVPVVLAGMVWSMVAENQHAGVFSALAAVGGATFIASTVWQSRRG